jgi:flagellar protein FlaG
MNIGPTTNFTQAAALFPARETASGAAAIALKPADAAARAGGAASPAAPKAPAKDELAQAVKSINNVLRERSPGLEFSIDLDSDRSVVKVVDKDTNEVIRQMPSREALEIAKAIDKLQSLLVRDSA